MLNFYTAKQGEKLEERVTAVEQGGGGGGSSIPTIEIDCEALNLRFVHHLEDTTDEEEIFYKANTVVLVESEDPVMQEILGHTLIDYLKENITEDNEYYKLVFKNIQFVPEKAPTQTIALNKYSMIVNAFRYVYTYDGGFSEGLMISGGGSITIPLVVAGMGVGGICTVNSGIIARLGDPNPEDPSSAPADGWGNLAVSLAIPYGGIGL